MKTNQWKETRIWQWVLVAPDGEILETLHKFLGDEGWLVSSTKKKYITLKSAKAAALIGREYR